MLKDGPDGAIGPSPEKNNYFSDLPSFEQLTILVSHNDYVYLATRNSGFPRNISEYTQCHFLQVLRHSAF